MKLRLTGGYDYGSGDETAESYCFDDWGYLYVNTVTPDGYQVDGFFAEVGPEHRACNGGQYAPLQDVLQVIGFAFHVSLSIVFVCAERVIPCP